jgi:hypothetical protein
MSSSPDVELDLHGLVGIRLVDPVPDDVRAVTRQLGLTPTVLGRAPDLVLRFIDDFAHPSPLRVLGAGGFAHDDDSFFVLASGGRRRRQVRMPFEALGQSGAELVCQHGADPIPLLMDVLNLTALTAGVLPLHASAFTVNGTGVLVTGWAKGGKTETLLGFMAEGATHVGDEWVYLPGGGRMLGIPEPMRVWEWHLDDLPGLRERVGRRALARMGTLRMAERAMRGLAAAGGSVGGVARRSADVVGRQRFVHVVPGTFFGEAETLVAGSLDCLFLTVTHDDPSTTVLPITGGEVARRMAASLQVERSRLWEAYRHSLFAFPDRFCPGLETAGDRESALLLAELSAVPAYEVRHPYPVDIPSIVRAMRPILAAHRAQGK